MLIPISTKIPTRHHDLALIALDENGLQVPSPVKFEAIVRFAYSVAFLFWAAALEEPTDPELDEAFKDFIVRCVNRAPGVGDVLV